MTKKEELRNYIKLLDLDIAELIEKRNEAVAEFRKPGYFAKARELFCNNPSIQARVHTVDVPEDECVGVAMKFADYPAHYFSNLSPDIYEIRNVRWAGNVLVLSIHFKE